MPALAIWGAVTASGPAHAANQETPAAQELVCVVQPVGDSGVSGTVTFVQRDEGVEVTAELQGLTPGEHGFHVHQYGDCTADDATSAGGHFNPTHVDHAAPEAPVRHMGDLGNISADAKGNVSHKRVDTKLKLSGPSSILGRGVIVHAGRDDLKSQPTGDAGGRVGCGVIGIANPD